MAWRRRALTGLLAGLPLLCPAVTPTAHGFATFDTDVAICSRNEPGRRTEFSRRLDPVRACGRVASKLAAEIRASAAYKQDVQRQLKAFAREGSSRAQITIYCDTALASVEKFCAGSMAAKPR